MSFLLRKISQPPLGHFFLFYSQEDQGCGSLSASFPPQWNLNPPHSSILEKRLFTDYNMGEISDLMFWTNPQTLPVNRCHWASEFKSQSGVRWGVCTHVHRWREGREKPNPNKPFPGYSWSSRNLRTEEMNIFGLSDSDHLKWVKHFRDSGMANSHRMTWPFQGHPIELGPCTLEELGYGYQYIISLLLPEKTGISIRAWAIKARYLRRGERSGSLGKGIMKWTKWESLLSRQFSKVHLQVYKDISAHFSVGVRARSKVACLCYTYNPCTPCHPVHCNELQMDNQHPYPPSTPTS